MRRVWLRAAVLALAAAGVVAALTVYFSSESVPPCLVSGAPAWHAPREGVHHYEVVFPDRAACFYDMDNGNALVGALRLSPASGITYAAPLLDDVALRTASGVFTLDLRSGRLRRGGLAPFPSGILTLVDRQRGVMYVTRPGFLGFRVLDMRTAIWLFNVTFKGFTWNRRFGPNPPSHGLVLAPGRGELWVLDAPNSRVHVFDVRGLPERAPRQVADIRLSKPLSGNENPCPADCSRIGSLQRSSDGKYVYVGDAGDVIDAARREVLGNLEALHNSRVHLEVVFSAGRPSFPAQR
jgi:hypothetical protein